MPNPTTRTSECYSKGVMNNLHAPHEGTQYVHAVYGAAWDTIPTAVDRSRLIAAAPALLEALNTMPPLVVRSDGSIERFEGDYDVWATWLKTRLTAILKATGGTQS